MLLVTMRCALLKLESISWRVSVMDCSSLSSSSVRVRFLVVAGRDMIALFGYLHLKLQRNKTAPCANVPIKH